MSEDRCRECHAPDSMSCVVGCSLGDPTVRSCAWVLTFKDTVRVVIIETCASGWRRARWGALVYTNETAAAALADLTLCMGWSPTGARQWTAKGGAL